jgi:hypothetical protein
MVHKEESSERADSLNKAIIEEDISNNVDEEPKESTIIPKSFIKKNQSSEVKKPTAFQGYDDDEEMPALLFNQKEPL